MTLTDNDQPLIEYLESIDVEFDHAQEIVRRFTKATREARMDENARHQQGLMDAAHYERNQILHRAMRPIFESRIKQLEQQTKNRSE